MSETHKFLTRLEESGDLKSVIKTGYCAPIVLRDLELYRHVDALMKTGTPKMKAVLDAETKFNVCEKTVYNVLKIFK